jgi:hypothetical protein
LRGPETGRESWLIMTTKICKKCGVEKPIGIFRIWNGYARSECKECEAALRKAHYQTDPERFRAATRKWSKENPEQRNATKREWYKKNLAHHKATVRKRNYGISDEQYQQMLKEQEGGCAICGGNRRLAVDHCHNTGKVRGLLCMYCNTGIGHLRDSFELLIKAASYLRKFST